MKKTESITQNYVFRAAYRRGRNESCRNMVVYAWRNRQKTANRLGLTVSTKLGCAVVRNRIRRRLREAYRLLEDEMRGGYDIIIVARASCESSDFEQLKGNLREALVKLGVIV